MSKLSVRSLIEAGVHFGHRVSRWNPKMRPYIYGKRNLIHIINLKETVRGLARACHFIAKLAATGQQVVFVGTKRQIKELIETESRRCGMPFVTERWLGGTLTNFQTIHARLKRLDMLEEMESTGKMELYSKKIQASLTRELRRIKKNLDGVRELHRVPGALVVIDPRNEAIAVKEANKLGIPVIGVLDTDCDPDDVDIPIPANDDAIRSVSLILEQLVKAVQEGKANYNEKAAIEARAEAEQEEFQLASHLRRAQAQAQRGGKGGGRGGKPGGPGGRGRRPGGPSRPGDRRPAPAAAPASAAPAAAAAAPAAEAAPAADAPAPAPAEKPADAPAPAPAPEPAPAAEAPAQEAPAPAAEAPAPEAEPEIGTADPADAPPPEAEKAAEKPAPAPEPAAEEAASAEEAAKGEEAAKEDEDKKES
jgi:small subunit ribosomal protein S2